MDETPGALDVLGDRSAPSTVYAAMWARRRYPWGFTNGGTSSGIFKSIDAGRTWHKLTDGLPPDVGRIGLDIYRRNPKVLFAVGESDTGGAVDLEPVRSRSGGILRSDASGGARRTDHSPHPRRTSVRAKHDRATT